MKPKFKKLMIDIKVGDLDRAVKFYKDILGLSLIHEEPEWASFEVFGAELHLYLHSGAKSGIEFRVADIKKEVTELKNKGVKFFIDKNQAGLVRVVKDIMEFTWGKAAYFKDSEGNDLSLIEDL